MGKKSKKHIKLDPEWSTLLINVIVGPQLSVLIQKYPDLGHRIFIWLMDRIDKVFKEHDNLKDDKFVADAVVMVADSWSEAVQTLIMTYLHEGMPKESKIIVPKFGSDRQH